MTVTSSIRITLYTKRDCSLCDKAKAVLDEFSREFPLAVETVDIESDPSLFAEYKEQIPVVFIEGRKAFKFRIDPAELRRRLDGLRKED